MLKSENNYRVYSYHFGTQNNGTLSVANPFYPVKSVTNDNGQRQDTLLKKVVVNVDL